MAFKFNGNEGLTKLINLIKGMADTKVDKVSGKGLSANDFTNELKTKLDGIEEKANNYAHPQHAGAAGTGFKKITVDGLGHITAIEDVTKDDVTALGIPAQDTTYSEATESAAGLMPAAAVTKLAGIAEGANKYIHATHTEYASGLYKVQVDAEGHVVAAVAVAKADITALGIPGQDTTYVVATQELDGLMSAADKKKLDGIEEGANKYIHATHDAAAEGFYKVTVDEEGHVTKTTAVQKSDVTALGIPGELTPLSTDIEADGESDAKAATPKAVKTYVDGKVSTVYKPAGSAADVASLPALSKANVGKVVNMTAEFTTTDTFIEGAGKVYPAGTNVVVANPSGTTYQYDVLAGFIDLTPYAKTEDFSEMTAADVETIWNSVFTA